MGDLDHARRILHELHAIGIAISLDNFGTSYSNLSVLRSLPLDVLKIDRSLIHDVTAAPEDVSITRAVLMLAKGLKLRVLAEGVETEGQLKLLIANGCELMQGFVFSAPLPASAIEQMLGSGRKLPETFLTRQIKKRTLLIVDDEENVISSLRRLLRGAGYHIVTASSGPEGLARLAEHDVDVIISDQRMPGMTGVELLRRAKELYPDTVRIVLSGYTELTSITDAVNEGAIYKFLTKPWDDERLRAHVAEAFMRKGPLRREPPPGQRPAQRQPRAGPGQRTPGRPALAAAREDRPSRSVAPSIRKTCSRACRPRSSASTPRARSPSSTDRPAR